MDLTKKTTQEIEAATGLSPRRIGESMARFEIHPDKPPSRPANAPLLVLPYPGGRHPRIGFLDGAIRPQRETKVRANAVATPDAMFGRSSEMRGPLAGTIAVAEIADVIGFLMGPDSPYVSGQVLFADGGRHLFSSHTA